MAEVSGCRHYHEALGPWLPPGQHGCFLSVMEFFEVRGGMWSHLPIRKPLPRSFWRLFLVDVSLHSPEGGQIPVQAGGSHSHWAPWQQDWPRILKEDSAENRTTRGFQVSFSAIISDSSPTLQNCYFFPPVVLSLSC